MASRKDWLPRFSVYQDGRGREPMIVVGRTMLLVALYMQDSSRVLNGVVRQVDAAMEQRGDENRPIRFQPFHWICAAVRFASSSTRPRALASMSSPINAPEPT